MNTTIQKFTLFFPTCLLACFIGHAAEQDNWYLAWEKSISNSYGVAYYEDNSTGIGQIYQLNGSSTSGKISVYDLNGSLDRHITIASSRNNVKDLCLDAEGNIYIAEWRAVTCLANDGTFKWRKGKNASISSYGSGGTGDGEFGDTRGITQGPDGNLYVADYGNYQVQVLDKNGTFIKKFGENGSAPGQLNRPYDLIFLPDGRLIVGDDSYLNYFDSNGTFIIRKNSSSAKRYVSLAPDGTIWNYQRLRDADASQIIQQSSVYHEARTAFTPEGDLIESGNGKLRLWKRAYRTKGLVNRNVIPQPAIRGISQRAGTNIIDLDFEIVDQDDSNVTVGILAAQDGAFDDTSKWILPQTWVDGTGSKIGTPIATNQVHRLSWNVKPDWPDSTGTLKFEIICHDARRTAPVDLHFLTLPLSDGNLTISRSPLKDSDFESYFKFLLTKDTAGISFENGSIVKLGATPPVGSTQYIFTNAGKEGREGPTWTETNASYVGTNLEGNVSMTSQGIQEWTVPVTGTYVIEAVGARGGKHPSVDKFPGAGAYVRGKFSLNSGDVIKILVGQIGESSSGSTSGGGGGSFVVLDQNNTPLVVAGGGGGLGYGPNAEVVSGGNSETVGLPSWEGIGHGTNGQAGTGSAPGGGFFNDNSNSGKSFLNGGEGYNASIDGGFGGGGGTSNNYKGGGGGGYSGGGGTGGYGGGGGGGGGSFSADTNSTIFSDTNFNTGLVIITKIGNLDVPQNYQVLPLITNALKVTGLGKKIFINQFPNRIATSEEVQKAREAATAGGVNQWTAKRPIQPRNLPNKVNEYGFDTGDHGTRAWWVVQE